MYKITVKDFPSNVTYVQEGTNLGKVVSRLLERMSVDNLAASDLLWSLGVAIYRCHHSPANFVEGPNFVVEVDIVGNENDHPTN